MGMIIRVAFNNRDWSGKCINADQRDQRLFKCWQKTVKSGWRIDKKGNCLADCWESTLCKNFFWENPKGNFEVARAKGKVFFVFPDIDNSLVLFAKSRIKQVAGNRITFHEFNPMVPQKWVRGLSSEDLLRKVWRRNTYRYINEEVEDKIKELFLIKDDQFEDSIEVEIKDKEGTRILRRHLLKERSSKLVITLKKSLKSYDCIICGFNFKEKYGKLGVAFIEAHHTKPLASLKKGELISTKDLIPVCSNCHRMIHRRVPPHNWRNLLPK